MDAHYYDSFDVRAYLFLIQILHCSTCTTNSFVYACAYELVNIFVLKNLFYTLHKRRSLAVVPYWCVAIPHACEDVHCVQSLYHKLYLKLKANAHIDITNIFLLNNTIISYKDEVSHLNDGACVNLNDPIAKNVFHTDHTGMV